MKRRGVLGKGSKVENGMLNAERTTKYRAIIARANFIMPDRCDIGFAVKELARKMANPIEIDWEDLCRLARYLAGRPRLRIWFDHQPLPVTKELQDTNYCNWTTIELS